MNSRDVGKTAPARRLTVLPGAAGWEILDEEGSQLLRRRVTDDWHRVERARLLFALETGGLDAWGRRPGDDL